MHRWVVTAAVPLTGCKNPLGHFPQLCLSILWAGVTPPCLGLCWVYHRTLAKMLPSKRVLLMGWKMGSQNTNIHTQRSHVSPEMTDNSNQKEHYNSFFKKPSEIVYSDSLQQGEWVKLLNRIHSDWLNWSQAKTDLQDLRDSGHWARKRETASTENVQTTILMGNNKWASPRASMEIYNNESSRPKSSRPPLFRTCVN